MLPYLDYMVFIIPTLRVTALMQLSLYCRYYCPNWNFFLWIV